MLSVVKTWTASLLKRSIYARRDSSLPCMITSSEASNFGCRREAVKCLENILPSCFHEVMDSSGRLLYQDTTPLPESGWEDSVFDGPSDSSIVEEGASILDVLVRVCCPNIGSH